MNKNASSITIGTIKERKNNENRVGLTPYGVSEIIKKTGAKIIVEKKAGVGSGYADADYKKAGAVIANNVKSVFTKADLIVKIKEIIPEEYHLLNLFKEKTLFTYLHLAGVDKGLTLALIKNKITGIAYELVTDDDNGLPLLTPMSMVAGWQAITYAEEFIQKKYGGKGIVLGAMEEQADTGGHVVIIGTGVVGEYATRKALAIGCNVTVFGRSNDSLHKFKARLLKERLNPLAKNLETKITDDKTLISVLKTADVVIGAVLIKGDRAPKILKSLHLKCLRRGSVVIDVSIDQGGCTDWTKPTSHSEPIYIKNGVVFCAIPNMPGQVARTSTQMLTTATLPFILKIANHGSKNALIKHEHLKNGLNTYNGFLTNKEVADVYKLNKNYSDWRSLIN